MAPHPEDGWTLHPQLAADCAAVGDLPLCRVLVFNDANYPWMILVPRRAGLAELCDLNAPEQPVLIGEITRCGGTLKTMTGAPKLNVAALGNVVPQLHVHVIARFPDDSAWPRPVWGVVPARPYRADELAAFVRKLRGALGLA